MKPGNANKQTKLPSIQWHPTAKQWFARIGYHLSPKTGERVRSYQYLGADQGTAYRQAIGFLDQWQLVVARFKKRNAEHKEVWPDDTPSLPVWPTEEQKQRYANPTADIDLPEVEAPNDKPEIVPLTLQQAKEKFLADYRERLNRTGKFGRTVGTYNNLASQLKSAMKGLDPSRYLTTLGKADLQTFISYWMALPDGIEPRTAENYINAFRQMLKHFDADEAASFTMPKGAAQLFAKCKAPTSEKNISRYDPAMLRIVLAKCSERVRLYVYLSLNLGAYQKDIAMLNRTAISAIDGEPHIKWIRQKKRNQHKMNLWHHLWPETVALIEKHKAPENEHGVLLLNEDGGLLWSQKMGKDRSDNIGTSWYRACDNAKVRIPFEQFRKWGGTAMESIANSDVQRLYRGQPSPGSAKLYVLGDFVGKLTPALKRWRERLIQDKVLY